MTEPHATNYLELNLRYLLSLRSIAIGAQILALIFIFFNFSLLLPWWQVIAVITALAVYTVYSLLKLRRKQRIRSRHILQQLIVDVIALSLLVYFTGGSTNPFIFFFLLPITFAAATLNLKQTCLIAGLAAISYTALMFFHVPMLHDSDHQHGFDLHIWGMWYGFLVSSGLLAYYVSRIGLSFRRHDRALAKAREANLKTEQVLALGTLAAGTAHELGTPLATMAVLANELEHVANDEIRDDIKILRTQIDRCKSILSRMAVDAGQAQADAGHPVVLDQYLHGLFDQWQPYRDHLGYHFKLNGTTPALTILSDRTFEQAILNVLNNAATAARSEIDCRVEWDAHHLTIVIVDDGAGIDRDNHQDSDGLGIGLFLSRITLNRLGGDIQLKNRAAPCNGTEATLSLPLDRLLVTE